MFPISDGSIKVRAVGTTGFAFETRPTPSVA